MSGGLGNQLFALHSLSLITAYSDTLILLSTDSYKSDPFGRQLGLLLDQQSRFLVLPSSFLVTLFLRIIRRLAYLPPLRYFSQFLNDPSQLSYIVLSKPLVFLSGHLIALSSKYKEAPDLFYDIAARSNLYIPLAPISHHSASIHFRAYDTFGDHISSSRNLSYEYFFSAIKLATSLSPGLTEFRLFSDLSSCDALTLLDKFRKDFPALLFVSSPTASSSPHSDFSMIQRNAFVIISNSTYSLWAAFFAKQSYGDDVTIISPSSHRLTPEMSWFSDALCLVSSLSI